MGSNTPGAASSAADLEAQEAPKSRPRDEKIDVKKRYIFDIDFGRVQASFWKSFSKVFLRKFRENCINRILAKTLKISISSWGNAYF